MAKDYAKKSTRKKPSKAKRQKSKPKSSRRHVPGWFWLVTGLLVGVFIAGLVYLKEYNGSPLFIRKNVNVAAKVEQTQKKQATKQHSQQQKTEPKLDFYTILPKMKVAVPETEQQVQASANKEYYYVLQIASFKHYKDADKLRAELSLQGFMANITKITVKGTTWNRVFVGPFTTKEQAHLTQKDLYKQKVKAVLMKLEKAQG